MSKTIEVSDQDYARIQSAAAADGMPLGAWVVEHLPLDRSAGGAARGAALSQREAGTDDG